MRRQAKKLILFRERKENEEVTLDEVLGLGLVLA